MAARSQGLDPEQPLRVVALGGGRMRSDQVIDPAVGLSRIVELGAAVLAGDPLVVIEARNAESAAVARDMVLKAISIGDKAPAQPPLVGQRLNSREAS